MRRLAGAAVLVVGILSLAYGGFSYTQETHDAKLGPLEFQVKEREHVNIPAWAGAVAVLAGGALLFIPGRKGGGGS